MDSRVVDSVLGEHSADFGDLEAAADHQSCSTPKSPKNYESPTAMPRIREEKQAKRAKSADHQNEDSKDTLSTAAESTIYRKKPTPKKEKAQSARQNTHSLVLFGGSFDPPHIGHVEIITALHAIAQRLIIIPAFRNPFKPPPIAPIQTRIAWLQMLCAHLSRAEVSDYEMRAQKNNQAIYAIEWVEYFARESTMDSRDSHTDAATKPLLALGSDSLASLPRWREATKLARLVEILPILRESSAHAIDSKIAESKALSHAESSIAFAHTLEHIHALGFTCHAPIALRPYAISSSQIRAAIARGEFTQIAHALPQSIAKLVRKIY